MTSDCPWSNWVEAAAPFCEAPLCAWVREPGNTWSNVGFLVAAVAIWGATRVDDRHLRPMGWILVLMCAGSAFFHASGTRAGLAVDYLGMVAMTAWMDAFAMGRAAGLGRRGRTATFFAVAVVGMAPFVVPALPMRTTFVSLNLLCPITEAVLALRPETRAPRYRWFFVAWATFAPAMVLWFLDAGGTLCDPANHVLSGHAAWHLLDAAMFWSSFLYYRDLGVSDRV